MPKKNTIKKHLLLCISAFFLIIVNGQLKAQGTWAQTNGPYGKTNVMAIVPSDSTIVVSTGCGYFSKKKINNSWHFDSTANYSVYTNKGDSLYTSNGSLNLSHFSNPNVSLTTINSSISLIALSHSDSCLYGGDSYLGFGKSSDFGHTWVYQNNGLPTDTGYMSAPPYVYYTHNVHAIEVTINYIFCGTHYGVYRSTGALTGWTTVNTGLPISNVTFIKSFNDTLFMFRFKPKCTDLI